MSRGQYGTSVGADPDDGAPSSSQESPSKLPRIVNAGVRGAIYGALAFAGLSASFSLARIANNTAKRFSK